MQQATNFSHAFVVLYCLSTTQNPAQVAYIVIESRSLPVACRQRQNQRKNLHHTRGITLKRVTRDGTHLRGLAPGLHSCDETSQRRQAVGDTVRELTGHNPRQVAFHNLIAIFLGIMN